MQTLKEAVQAYADRHANSDGLALTPIPGLRMMCVRSPRANLHSIYRPLICMVLQGAKHMTVGTHARIFAAGESVIVSADMPVVGRIVQANRDEPYLAVAVEIEMTVLRELGSQMGTARAPLPAGTRSVFAVDTDAEILDCASRLMRLLERPDAVPLLRPGIMRELYYWLLSGKHGAALSALALPDSYASQIAKAVVILRDEYRSRVPVERLAAAAAMSLTAFHKRFKELTSLTPVQYQKRLRLIEARRIMLDEGLSATAAAFEVGYESVSQFTREYGRMFQVPPKRDARRARTRLNAPRAASDGESRPTLAWQSADTCESRA
ncbi:AraC family transcriptional regulator [Xanthobacteraceae bacterium Astr-EGSB]|uniref:AraC family transcriptional regulator n=1 Tax=Astrobacterium formosum TaxID=3069710 RepID=UPI0027B3077C|nr:AraC family transcriptional regulator [Xanthobacteraceae bacterium Astr-EGSB]